MNKTACKNAYQTDTDKTFCMGWRRLKFISGHGGMTKFNHMNPDSMPQNRAHKDLEELKILSLTQKSFKLILTTLAAGQRN